MAVRINNLNNSLLVLAYIAGTGAASAVYANPDEEDMGYVMQYCDQTYGSGYYDNDEARQKAIEECIREQSQYYNQAPDAGGQSE